MATLDPILRAMIKNRMDAVVLEAGRLPRLRKGDGEHEVTQTKLDAATIERLLGEIAPPGSTLEGEGDATFTYALDEVEIEFRMSGGRGNRYVIGRAIATPEGGEVTRPVLKSVRALSELLDLMLAEGASDLHLAAGQPPRLRKDGELGAIPDLAAPTSEEVEKLVFEITPPRNREEFEARNDTDFAHEIPGRSRFRVNVFRDHLGVGAVLRQIPEKVPTAEDLGLPEVVRDLAFLSKGLVLVTGPTGSGKSTTLAAIVDRINRLRHDHIITIEDPIEFVHPSRLCMVNQREVGVHTASFKQALRAALREDPDVVLVGEMRDLETISIAVETAETGHLVFGTLHTTTAASTVERLVDQFPGDRQAQVRVMLADSLRAVIAQTLLKKIGGGRVAAYEILVCSPAVANLIREGKTFQIASAMQTGKRQGMVTLTDALLDLVEKKLVEPREAYIKAVDKEALTQRFQAVGIELDLDGSPDEA